MNDGTLTKNPSINRTMTNNSQFNSGEKFDTLVINNGRSPATNLLLQLSYPNGKILDYYTSFQSENVSFQLNSPHLLIAKIERMPKDAIMDIHTIVECDLNANDTNHTSFINDQDRLAVDQHRTTPCPPK